MSASLALILIAGLIASAIFRKAKLPGLLGILIVGILVGPYALNLIHPGLLSISADLREIALIVILLMAGFHVNLKTLRKVGKSALLMGFVPALFEFTGIVIIAPMLLGLSLLEAAILGSILCAVSPAVVVPSMIDLKKRQVGTGKGIPGMMITAASLDDVFVIVVFTSLMGLYADSGRSVLWAFASVPVSILLGCAFGALLGISLVVLFRRIRLRDTFKVIILISSAILLITMERALSEFILMSGLLAVMVTGMTMLEKYEVLVKRLSLKLEKIWIGAQILLFALVGSQVDISVAWQAGLAGLTVIVGGLVFRFVGVWLALTGSNLNARERLFCMLAYSPKATVQAAIGGIPLAAGVASGDIMLAIAVMAILLTAPIGATATKLGEKRLLSQDKAGSVTTDTRESTASLEEA